MHDLSDAVHGDLAREAAPGRAGGTYDTDVSPWLRRWIIGVEWDPAGVAPDRRAPPAPRRTSPGRYFAATDDATPTERWIATPHGRRRRGSRPSAAPRSPVAMANWPTADPLSTPTSRWPSEDLVGVDANHVLPTDAWPGGTFASFHAYPYYPDFQRYEPGLQDEDWNGARSTRTPAT